MDQALYIRVDYDHAETEYIHYIILHSSFNFDYVAK